MPVLDELEKEYQGRLEVQFIDVFKYPKVAKEYGVQSIPVQIFYGASGKEIYRHEGFIAKEDILKKWQELGVDLAGGMRGDRHQGDCLPPRLGPERQIGSSYYIRADEYLL